MVHGHILCLKYMSLHSNLNIAYLNNLFINYMQLHSVLNSDYLKKYDERGSGLMLHQETEMVFQNRTLNEFVNIICTCSDRQ